MRALLISLAALILGAAACTGGAHAQITKAPASKTKVALKVDTIARGLVNPWALQFLPDGRMLVTERPGRLRIVSTDGKVSPPIRGVPMVFAWGQGGLLDVALSPDFASTGIILLAFAEPREILSNGTALARGRLVLDDVGGRLDDVTVIFRQDPSYASPNHFGSRIVFNSDGSLFLTTGDRYFARDQAQNPGNHLGKVLRLMPDGKPFAGNPNLPGWRPEVWSIGHRNVQGAALHPATGKLWTIEHGARGGDEINVPQAGKNYGWPVISYGRDYSGLKIGEGAAKAGLEQPIYYWDPSIAPSGATFYTADLVPEWKGNLFVGALAGQALHRLVLDGERIGGEEMLLTELGQRIRDVRQGPDGALWVLTDERDGSVVRVGVK